MAEYNSTISISFTQLLYLLTVVGLCITSLGSLVGLLMAVALRWPTVRSLAPGLGPGQ